MSGATGSSSTTSASTTSPRPARPRPAAPALTGGRLVLDRLERIRLDGSSATGSSTSTTSTAAPTLVGDRLARRDGLDRCDGLVLDGSSSARPRRKLGLDRRGVLVLDRLGNRVLDRLDDLVLDRLVLDDLVLDGRRRGGPAAVAGADASTTIVPPARSPRRCGARRSPASRSARRCRDRCRRSRAARCAPRSRASRPGGRRRARRAGSSASCPTVWPAPDSQGEVVVERPAEDHRDQRAADLGRVARESPAADRITTAAGRRRSARSTSAASTRRLSSLGPVKRARRMPVRWRSPTDQPSARPGPEIRLDGGGMIPPVERVAVIDLGSNSWRLVVFGYEPDTPVVEPRRRDPRGRPDRRRDGRRGRSPAARARRPRAAHRRGLLAPSAAPPASTRSRRVATSAIRDAANGEELLADIERTTGLDARVISGARGGPLRLARDRELDHDRGRLRARHRRRQHPDAAARGPAAGRRRLAAARRRARERALPARREGERQGR